MRLKPWSASLQAGVPLCTSSNCQPLQRAEPGQTQLQGSEAPAPHPTAFLGVSPPLTPRSVIRVPHDKHYGDHGLCNYSQAPSFPLILSVYSSGSRPRRRYYYFANLTRKETEAQKG